MDNVLCFTTLIGFAASLPFGSDMTAGLTAAATTAVDEGNLFEGDIITLKRASVIIATLTTSSRKTNTTLVPQMRNLVRDQSQLWPNKVFPYKFSGDFNDLQKFNVETALLDLASETCVKFRERTNEPTYIVFKSYAKICASVVGYTDLSNLGGEMPVYVSAPGCQMRGQIQHEILHSLGFWHEHTRPDRNEYVTVNWDNIEPGSESNFEARTWMDTQTMDLPYDLDSVMHYSGSAFSKDGSATLTPKVMRKNVNMGQRFRITKLDIAKLNRLYNCDNRYYKGNEILG